jgi:hypothetical protein
MTLTFGASTNAGRAASPAVVPASGAVENDPIMMHLVGFGRSG